MRTTIDILRETYEKSANHSSDHSDTSRKPASAAELTSVIKNGSNGNSEPQKPIIEHQTAHPIDHNSRFAVTTGTRDRILTPQDAVKVFTKLTKGHPLVHETKARPLSPKQKWIPGQRMRKNKRNAQVLEFQYVDVHLRPVFSECFGIDALTVALTLNYQALEHIVSQFDVQGAYYLNVSDEEAKASFLADILAFLGIWDIWYAVEQTTGFSQLKDPTSTKFSELYDELLLRIDNDDLYNFCEMIGPTLLYILAKETRIIATNRHSILKAIASKSRFVEVNRRTGI